MWVHKVNEFCNRSMKSFFQNNDIEMIQRIIRQNLLLIKDLLEP